MLSTKRLAVFAFLALVASLLPADVAVAAPGKGKSKKTDPKTTTEDSTLVTELQAALALLDTANPGYGGHRGKAMHEMKAAVADLQKEMHKRGQKAPRNKSKFQADDVAIDGQVSAALVQVGTIQKQLGSLASTPLRTKAGGHLETAIIELKHALAIAKDHLIVHQLQAAYRLLDEANSHYAGHRGKARHEINAAIVAIEHELHKRGMKGHHKKHPPEPETVSDLEVKQTQTALVLIHKELSALHATSWREKAIVHVAASVAELTKALAVAKDHILVADLQAVFRLVDKADPIYKGHRGKAMHEIKAAIGDLEKEMHARGLKPHHHVHVPVPIADSDLKLKSARDHLAVIAAKLALLPPSDLRTKAAAQIKAGITELGLALVVNKQAKN